jgi:hypothetical protein
LVIAMQWRTELFQEADAPGAECDALLTRLQERRQLVEKQAPDVGVIYKQNDNALVGQAEPDDVPISDEAAVLADMVGELIARLNELEQRIDALENDSDSERGNVVPLLELKGGRHAA